MHAGVMADYGADVIKVSDDPDNDIRLNMRVDLAAYNARYN